MWNSWMENAKAMAADLDSKINESVGIDASGNPIDLAATSTPNKTIPASSFETPLAAVSEPSGRTDDGDDAWNDDFDFDDEDDAGDDKPLESTTAPEPLQAPAAMLERTPIPEAKKEKPTKAFATPLAKSLEEESPAPITPQAITPTESTTIPKPSPPLPTPVASPKESPKPLSKPNAASASNNMPINTAPSDTAKDLTSCVENENNDGSGWGGEDDLDIDVGDEGDSTVEKTIPLPNAKTPISEPTTVVTTPVSSSGGLFSNLSNLTKTADSLLSSQQKEPEEGVDVATKEDENDASAPIEEPSESEGNDQFARESTPASPPDATPKPETSAPTPTFSPGGLISSIATPKPKTSAPTPKFTPGGSLFSRINTLAQTADSLFTAAVEQSAEGGENKIVESLDPVDDGGWDEDNDDDFFEDDKNEDEQVAEKESENTTDIATNFPSANLDSKEKVKTEESTSSFVKLSPTSSISTPELVPQKIPIPQQPKEEGEKDLSGETSSPPPMTKTVKTPPIAASAAPVTNIEDDPRFQKLQETLRLREEQLIDKGTQLNELQLLLESRDEQHKKKLSDTKEEAKKRILRAKERCEAAEVKLAARSSGDSDDAKKKQLIIDELMEEGQALAKKQSVMERAVRDANAETRALAEELRQESHGKQEALQKIEELQSKCKSLTDSLNYARKGESQAGKLENDLLSSRADAEEKASTILSLQQRLKESVAESKELQRVIDETRKSAAHEAQQEKTSMRREHNDLIGDLEQRLRTTEREAGVREDALRHEISEIRKRWQDSVRRADALSMDVQSSTAPLMRQLESMERQSRLRATNSAELESRLRSDLEEAVIENERLAKESSEFRSKLSKLERSVKDRDQELSKAQYTVTEQARDLENLRNQEEKLIKEAEARQAEYEKVERLANEGVARVRSEMSKTVTDSEERYRGQIDKLQKEMVVEKEKRSQLEAQVSQLLESGGGLFAATQPSQPMMQAPNTMGIKRESKPKKLHKAENQAEILAGALGLGMDSSDDDSDFESDDDGELFDGEGQGSKNQAFSGGYHSFAAIEQLSSKLKSSEIELKSMRKSLKESNEIRQSLVEELGEARAAKEKLPLFEAKVQELTQENRQLEMEISGLKEDVADVRELYRTQLNVLLEEKTASASANANPTKSSEAQGNGDDEW
eukprot:CAMPEP_0116103398 /NCGR_PEP_ID=MMETSP0327-20121206/13861_1 /TAXON_ID=44447 /ORGANISM="Pseudo-nitzschia delicatissima, Strain B596" /LENGTH=1170 /DNA_ID=CAMNT_0003595501 /DNA_START=212 /DNA_END=3724 /DNA_ORIENTATION=+